MELPITDSIIIAIAKLVDDVQVESRQPTHSDLDVQFKRAGFSTGRKSPFTATAIAFEGLKA